MQTPKRLVTYERILQAVWGTDLRSERLLHTHVRELRRVVGPDVIVTIVGRG
jgi:DNA-binding response OmpR family regulator